MKIDLVTPGHKERINALLARYEELQRVSDAYLCKRWMHDVVGLLKALRDQQLEFTMDAGGGTGRGGLTGIPGS